MCIRDRTGYSAYAYDAYRLHAKGYILKPVSKALIQEELDHLDIPQKVKGPQKRVQIHTFGTFDVFVDQQPLRFSRSRAKELLAYLVDRQGNGVTPVSYTHLDVYKRQDYYNRTTSKHGYFDIF